MIEQQHLLELDMGPAHALRLALCSEALVISGKWDTGTGFDPTDLIADLRRLLRTPENDRDRDHRYAIAAKAAALSRLARAAWLFKSIELRSVPSESDWCDLSPVFLDEASKQGGMHEDDAVANARSVMKAAISIAGTIDANEAYRGELRRIGDQIGGHAPRLLPQ